MSNFRKNVKFTTSVGIKKEYHGSKFVQRNIVPNTGTPALMDLHSTIYLLSLVFWEINFHEWGNISED